MSSIDIGLDVGNKYERVSLHPDDSRYDASEPARVQPDSVFDIPYKELIQELRYNMAYTADQPVPVFAFPYDWRQSLENTVPKFDSFVEEVLERTMLIPHYHEYYKNNPKIKPKVNLVGHSLGGLVITRYLIKHGSKKQRVHKVATLGTPFRGSFEAAIKLLTGTAQLDNSNASSRERKAARMMPSLYQILPTCPHLELDPGSDVVQDVFNPDFWQPSIVGTLAEYVRLHDSDQETRSDPEKSKARALIIFKALLNSGKKHQELINNLKELETVGLAQDRWLCIVGVDSTTRTGLKISGKQSEKKFELRSDERMNQWNYNAVTNLADKVKKIVEPQDPRYLTGDGTVPLISAMPPFLQKENIVCVTPDDFGYWEIQDRILSAQAGFHGILPNMDMLHRLIVRHFRDDLDPHQNTWGRCVPGVAENAWQTPFGLKNLRLKVDK